jgi:hypothetical protein
MRLKTVRTPGRRRRFLAALARGDSVSIAAVSAGATRTPFYVWRADDPQFAADWDQALEAGTDLLEDEARRRAMDGSDLLLIFLLRARRPEIYNRKQQLALSGDLNAPPIGITAQESNDVRIYLPHNHRDLPPTPFEPVPPRTIDAVAEPVVPEKTRQPEQSEDTSGWIRRKVT